MGAYYNEIDPYAAQWLRNLISAGHIPDGDVDERSIADVQPLDIKNYTQCHFFAGIGGWSHALRLAGWPDDRPIWTGSCPCQPFSVAGKGKGTADERHLWPVFFRLIAECKPSTVFGEQVASRAGREWLAGVFADLEGVGYAAAGADLCAAGVGAPHIRQRLFWVAHTSDIGARRVAGQASDSGRETVDAWPKGLRRADGARSTGGTDARDTGDMAHAHRQQDDEEQQGPATYERGRGPDDIGGRGLDYGQSDMGDTSGSRFSGDNGRWPRTQFTDGHAFGDAEWRRGADGKTRRVKPGVCLLAHGVPARVGKLRAYGNAIVPQVAAEVIKAFMDA